MRLGLAARKYLQHAAALGRSPRTVEEYEKRLGYFRDFAYGRKTKKLSSVDAALVRDYHQSLIARELQPSSRKALLSCVRDFLRWAYERKLILTNLAPRVEIPRPGKKLPPTPLSEEEVLALLGLPGNSTLARKRNTAILELLYGCALRGHELLGLNVGDLDLDAGTLFVRGKGGKDRLVPVNDTALAAVATYLQAGRRKPRQGDPLFVTSPAKSSPKRMNANDLKNMFHRLNRRFPKHVHAHLLRHTCAVHMLKGGADLRFVQALLGHANPDTTSGYLGLVRDDLKRAYDAAVETLL